MDGRATILKFTRPKYSVIRSKVIRPDLARSTEKIPENIGKSRDNTATILASTNLDKSNTNRSQHGAKRVSFVSVTGYNKRSKNKTAPARHGYPRATKQANANGNSALEVIPTMYRR